MIQVGVGDKERIDIPERQGKVSHHLADQVNREAPLLPGRRGGVQVPAEGIGAVGIEHIPGIDDVAARFGHFLPFAIQHQPQANHILEGHAVMQQGADGVQRIEPAARLVDCFADEIRRVLFPEGVFIFEG